MNVSLLTHPCRHLFSTAVLAVSGLFTAAGAQDLSEAGLAIMGETTAIRMGCGVADINYIQAADIQQQLSNSINHVASVWLWFGFVVAAIRMCPKEKRGAMWKWYRRSLLTWCFTGPFICMAIYSVFPAFTNYNQEMLAAWQLSVFYTIFRLIKWFCCAVRWAFGMVTRKTSHASLDELRRLRRTAVKSDLRVEPVKAGAADDVLYVSVAGDQVQLRQGDSLVTRSVEPAAEVGSAPGQADADSEAEEESTLCKAQ